MDSMMTKQLIKGYAINITDEMIDKLPKNELKNIKYVKDFESYHHSGIEYKKIYVKQFIFADTNYNIENSLEKLEAELKQRFKNFDIYKNAIFFAGVPK
jgi:hypothetical protein